MALTPKRITLLTTAAPVVIEMVRKYWPLIEQKLRENPELLSSVQVQLRRLAELRKAGNSPESLRERIGILREQVSYLRASADDDGEVRRAATFTKQLDKIEASIRVVDAASPRHRTKDLRVISKSLDALTEKIMEAFIEEKSQDSYPQ
ncbi:MAG: hypothetical protein EOL91_13170 [Actinobacteria bacterium]|nr:hypothetical protein [Actinomycetota bacterium]